MVFFPACVMNWNIEIGPDELNDIQCGNPASLCQIAVCGFMWDLIRDPSSKRDQALSVHDSDLMQQ